MKSLILILLLVFADDFGGDTHSSPSSTASSPIPPEGKEHCYKKINIDERKIFTQYYDRAPTMHWKEAFDNNTFKEFIIQECVKQVILYFGCEERETCCDTSKHGDDTTIIKYPQVDGDGPIMFTDCGNPKYVCLFFQIKGQSKKIMKTKIVIPLLCPKECDNHKWSAFTKTLKTTEYKSGISQSLMTTGTLHVHWISTLGTLAHCLEVTLKYGSGDKKRSEKVNFVVSISYTFHIPDYCGYPKDATLKIRHFYKKKLFQKSTVLFF